MRKKGLSLVEIIVAMIILAITMAGLANLFVSGKRYILHSRSRMTAGEASKYFLDPLQLEVRQDTWDNATLNCLGTGNCPNLTMGTAEGLDRNYTANYTVTPNFSSTNLTKVKVNITWYEPLP